MGHFRRVQSHLRRISRTICFDGKPSQECEGNYRNQQIPAGLAKHGAFQKNLRAFAKDQQRQEI